MKKTMFIMLISLLLISATVSAQVNHRITFGADIQINALTFNPFFKPSEEGSKNSKQFNTWQLMLSGKIEPAADLLLLFDHGFGWANQFNNTFENDESITNNVTKAVLMYQFYNDTNLQIYGGLGYNFVRYNFHNLIYHDDALKKNAKLDGSGFLAASQVNFIVADNLTIKANIEAAPFYTWVYEATESGDDIKRGSAYFYRLTAEYDINHAWSAKIGYSGSRSNTSEFTLNDYTVPEITFTQGGLQVGATYKF
ncbi:MAG: hypothetical protein ACE3NC_10630 [Candidatus Wallacebacter cryptica]